MESSRPSSVAVAIQICFPRITGEAQPLPGMGVFQRTWSVSLQVTGGFELASDPVALGPSELRPIRDGGAGEGPSEHPDEGQGGRGEGATHAGRL